MFNRVLKEQKFELEKDKENLEKEKEELQEEVRRLKDDLESLKTKKKIEEEDIKHMVKLKEERLEVENEKKLLGFERDKERAIAVVKDEYRDKLEQRLHTEVESMKEMYGQILERLPNLNARMKIDG